LGTAGFTRWIGGTIGSIGLAVSWVASGGAAGGATWALTGAARTLAATIENQDMRGFNECSCRERLCL
jgi:hypothetical protein